MSILELPIELVTSITLFVKDPKTLGQLLLSNSIFSKSLNLNPLTQQWYQETRKSFNTLVKIKECNGYKKEYWVNPKGKKEGEHRRWHYNGKLSKQSFYVHGEREGEYKEWYPSSERDQLWKQSFYVNDEIEGEYKEWWYNNGQLLKLCFYINGKLEGEYKEWYNNGQLLKQSFYVNGKREGEYKDWHSNGQLCSQSFYVNGKREGV